MDLTDDLLAILRCPVSRQPLRRATRDEVARAAESTGRPWEDGLATADGTRLYPVRDGFPILLREEAWEPGAGPPGR